MWKDHECAGGGCCPAWQDTSAEEEPEPERTSAEEETEPERTREEIPPLTSGEIRFSLLDLD